LVGGERFTHLIEDAAVFYVRECARILADDGVLHSTWFLFDKAGFPMVQEFQNALFVNDVDPTKAVIFDQRWLRRKASEVGLVITRVFRPRVRGFQWVVPMEPARPGFFHVNFPPDNAVGIVRASPTLWQAHDRGYFGCSVGEYCAWSLPERPPGRGRPREADWELRGLTIHAGPHFSWASAVGVSRASRTRV
jgi:hypothetical protein